jgi:MEMO1 family protein
MTRFLFYSILALCLTSSAWAVDKEPNVAGTFYSSNPKELSAQVDDFLSQASIQAPSHIQAMIVPHAGYVYSGPIAAYSYKAIAQGPYKTVVLLAPSHYEAFEGIALWPEGQFKTPLGALTVDTEFVSKFMAAAKGRLPLASPQAFDREHSLETQLPFIQRVLKDVKIVPILMSNPNPKTCQMVASLLNELIGSREDVLIIASSDMSHYFPYDKANQMDESALKAIKELNVENLWNGCFLNRDMEMCGIMPVLTVLLYAKERGLQAEVLKHANSGDTTGDKSKVVGYSSVIFYGHTKPSVLSLSPEDKEELMKLSQDTLKVFVTTKKVLKRETKNPRLRQIQGAFVTLRKKGELRGCIGHIIGQKPLWETVREMTIEAASNDPRFNPVSHDELKELDLEISVLTPPKQVPDASLITLGQDGVIVSDGGAHQGVFLPQVATETKWSKEELLSALCREKAGLPADCWRDPKISLYTFQAEVFGHET